MMDGRTAAHCPVFQVFQVCAYCWISLPHQKQYKDSFLCMLVLSRTTDRMIAFKIWITLTAQSYVWLLRNMFHCVQWGYTPPPPRKVSIGLLLGSLILSCLEHGEHGTKNGCHGTLRSPGSSHQLLRRRAHGEGLQTCFTGSGLDTQLLLFQNHEYLRSILNHYCFWGPQNQIHSATMMMLCKCEKGKRKWVTFYSHSSSNEQLHCGTEKLLQLKMTP